MTSKDLLVIALKVSAIIIFVDFINAAAYELPVLFATQANLGLPIWLLVMPIWLTLAAGICLWWFAVMAEKRRVAEAVAGGDHTVTLHNVAAVIVSVLGIYVFCYGIVDLVDVGANTIAAYQMYPHMAAFEPETQGRFAAAVAQIILGVVLALRASGILNAVLRLRGM